MPYTGSPIVYGVSHAQRDEREECPEESPQAAKTSQKVEARGGTRAHLAGASENDQALRKLASFTLRKSGAKRLAVERGETKTFPVLIPGEEKTHGAMTQSTMTVVKDGVDLIFQECFLACLSL
jgi:hypothetical protein